MTHWLIELLKLNLDTQEQVLLLLSKVNACGIDEQFITQDKLVWSK